MAKTKTQVTPSSNGNGLHNIRCSSCGHFFGKGRIIDGELYLYCKCKNWTVVLEGQTELTITGKEIYEKLNKSREEVPHV